MAFGGRSLVRRARGVRGIIIRGIALCPRIPVCGMRLHENRRVVLLGHQGRKNLFNLGRRRRMVPHKRIRRERRRRGPRLQGHMRGGPRRRMIPGRACFNLKQARPGIQARWRPRTSSSNQLLLEAAHVFMRRPRTSSSWRQHQLCGRRQCLCDLAALPTPAGRRRRAETALPATPAPAHSCHTFLE